MNRKTLVIVAMTLLVALTLTGLVYGLWYELLFIDGTVETGNVEVEWDPMMGCFDIQSKDVGDVSIGFDPQDEKTLLFTVTNGYPSYVADCQVGYRSVGTIPVHTEIEKFIPGPELNNCVIDQNPTTGEFTASCDELTVHWYNGLCQQLHQGDGNHGSLSIHVEQPAAELAAYTFQVKLQFNQFNESDCP